MLDELQSLDDKTKKRVLVIATIIIMVIIIGIWATYLNSIVAGPSEQAVAQAAPVAAPAPAQASGPSIWQNIEHWFGSAAASFSNIFQKPSQYNIQPNQ